MKRSTFVFIIACISTLSIVGCKNTNKKTQQENTIEISLASKALDVNGLLNVAEKQLNDTVVLKGVVKHTCSHSGRRCFIADSTGKLTIRVEAGGNIQSFNKELVNSEIVVTGCYRNNAYHRNTSTTGKKKSQKKRLKETKMPTTATLKRTVFNKCGNG